MEENNTNGIPTRLTTDSAGYRVKHRFGRGSCGTDGLLTPEQERIRRLVTEAEIDPREGVHLKSWDWSSEDPYVLLSVAGPEKTPFEGGLFEVEIRCSPKWYSLCFKTKVWHPNVSPATGEVPYDVLEKYSAHRVPTLLYLGANVFRGFGYYQKVWHPRYNLKNPKNPEAARQCRDNLDEFNTKARDWAARYAKLDLCENPGDSISLGDGDKGKRATKYASGVRVTSLSDWYYAVALHGDGRLACLNLNRHKLKGELTPSVGKFVALTHLYLAGNRLTGRIPEYLGDFNALRVLDLSDNRLTGVVPSTLSKIDDLQVLCLHGNKLTGLWDYTTDDDYAQSVTPSGDQATPDLPDALSQLLDCLTRLQEKGGPSISLGDNPWTQPPETIVMMGMKASREYFEDIYAEGTSTLRTNLKVVLVGHEGAGKTSLRQSIREQRPTPTEGGMESTVHIDIENIELDGTAVRFYDCAGQVAYTGLLQTFLTPRSLVLLVCDAAAFVQSVKSLDDPSQLNSDMLSLKRLGVCEWLRLLSLRIPYSAVILVATKCDLIRREDTANIATRLEKACSKWLEKGSIEGVRIESGVSLTSCAANINTEGQEEITYQAAFNKWIATLMKGCMQDTYYGPCVSLTSCAMNESQVKAEPWSCDWGGGETMCCAMSPPRLQHRIMREPNNKPRGVNRVFPRSWEIALTFLDALGEGRNPIIAARKRCFQDGDEQAGSHEKEAYNGITVQELKRKWLEVVQVLGKEGASLRRPEQALEWALTIRESEGSLVRHETYLFLDVIWLAKILKPLLNHKVRENANLSITLGDVGDSSVTLTDIDDIRSWERLKRHGILEPRLANAVWGDLSGYVLPTFAHLGLTFPLNYDSADGLVVLIRLPIQRPEGVGEEIDDFREDHDEVFRVRWKMGLGMPPGAVERVLTWCSGVGVTQTFWRFGVLVRGGVEYGRFALVVEYDDNDMELEIRVYGNVDSSASWAVLSYALSAVRYMALEFPGLQWRAWLDCPQPRHDDEKYEIHKHAEKRGDNLLHDSGCNRCHPEIGGLGVAAVKLLKMVDINEDKDKIFRGVEERFSKVRHQFKELQPEGLRAQRNTSVRIRIMTSLNSVDPEKLQELRQIKNIVETLQLQLSTMTSEWIEKVDSVMESYHGVMGKLDFLVAMVMAERADKIIAPRMACVLPPWQFSNKHGLTEEEMAVARWTERHGQWQDGDFKEEKGFLKTEMRLFLLCAHSKELVPCGHDGHGYRVERSRKWVRQTARLANVLYTLASTALPWGPVAGAIANNIWTAAVDQAKEKTAVGGEAKLAREIRNTPIRDNDLLQHGLKGETYDDLRKFVHEMEFRTLHDGSKESQSFNCFENVMVQVQARSGDAKPQWVLKKNEQAWLDAH